MKKTFDLNIETVLENWEVSDAIREIIANAEDETIISKSKPVEIYKDENEKWHIRDYGRGLKYMHFTQNENEEKLKRKDLIGKFGVGLKDALATFYRHNIKVTIITSDSIFKTIMTKKHGFNDIETLHAEIENIKNYEFEGTDFILENCPDLEIEKAKSNFIKYTANELLETTKYGEIYRKAKEDSVANIYVNGMKIAQEENFLFHYNITNINSAIKKALNRERSNVGRSAYTDRVKQILLNASDKYVSSKMVEQLEKSSYGNSCDEIAWVDVCTHMAKIINSEGNIVFLAQGTIINMDLIDTIKSEGKRIIYVPGNIADKFQNIKDILGNEMSTLDSFIKSYEKNFNFDFVDIKDLTFKEKEVYDLSKLLAKELRFNHLLNKIKISNTMHKNPYYEIVGLCDFESDSIIIKRSQLESPEDFLGTLIHEVIHYESYTDDCTREFENELTKIIGVLSCKLLNIKVNNSHKNIFNLFKF